MVTMRIIKSPHEPTSLQRTEATIEAGMKMALEVRSWMERNKEAFFAILGYLESLHAREVSGRVRDRVAVFCMQHGIMVDDDPYRFANAKFAGISRYMALMDPTLIGAPLRFNDSVIDCYGLLPVSYLDLEGDME